MLVLIGIILINLIVTILGFQAFRSGRDRDFLFEPFQVIQGRNIKGLILSNFAHGGMGHFIFNMMSLFFFAPVIVEYGSSMELILIYAAAGVGADLLTLFLRSSDASYRSLGASGSVSGIIYAAIVFDPSIDVMFFFVPIPIPGPLFAVAYILLSFYLMKQEGQKISHEAHLGGALAGFILAAVLAPSGLDPLISRIISWI